MTRFPLFLVASLMAAAPCLGAVNASAAFTVNQDWGSGANATLRIVNHGTSAIPAWPLEFDFDFDISPYNNVRVTSHAGAHFVQQRENYYTATIPAGGEIFFDMRVTPGGISGAEPRNITLAGQSLGAPLLNIADASGAEGDSGSRTLGFGVTLSVPPASGQTVTARFATSSGTATSGLDFTPASGTLTFTAGQSEKSVAVAVLGDLEDEGNESFTITLFDIVGAAVANSSARGTILDDDYTVEADIDGTTVFEGDGGTAEAVVRVQLDRPAAKVVTVRATTQSGTADASDFLSISQVLTFTPGESTRTLAVPIVDDLVPEATETFSVSLSQPSAGLVIANPAATVTIHDNDGSAFGSVLINEICAAPGNRAIRWDDDGTPRLGMGPRWMDPDFHDGTWLTGALPAGLGHAGLATNLGASMAGVTPSLYLRKEFTATAGQAAAAGALSLDVDFDDGFIAYLNGVEVARANMGPPGHFCFARQPAYNARPSGTSVRFGLGPAVGRLVEGRNVLAIQAHNAVVDASGNRFDLSPTVRVRKRLRGPRGLRGLGRAAQHEPQPGRDRRLVPQRQPFQSRQVARPGRHHHSRLRIPPHPVRPSRGAERERAQPAPDPGARRRNLEVLRPGRRAARHLEIPRLPGRHLGIRPRPPRLQPRQRGRGRHRDRRRTEHPLHQLFPPRVLHRGPRRRARRPHGPLPARRRPRHLAQRHRADTRQHGPRHPRARHSRRRQCLRRGGVVQRHGSGHRPGGGGKRPRCRGPSNVVHQLRGAL